jgi:MFS family permease
MTAGRLTGTRLLERLGRTRTLVSGGTTAALGMLLGALAPTLWAAVLGFVITGLGLANLFPVAVERAGTLAGPDGVAIASTLGYGGMLLGPPAIGFMADWYSLPAALTSVAVLAAVPRPSSDSSHGTRRRRALIPLFTSPGAANKPTSGRTTQLGPTWRMSRATGE